MTQRNAKARLLKSLVRLTHFTVSTVSSWNQPLNTYEKLKSSILHCAGSFQVLPLLEQLHQLGLTMKN